MDADDTITEECARKLHELALTAPEATTGFMIGVHIPPNPGDDGFTIVDHVKLFRNLPELRFEGRIHEQILGAIYRAGGAIERSDLYVVHSGYDRSPEGQQKKRDRDFNLLKMELADRPDQPFTLFNLGMTHYHLQEYEDAIPPLERSLTVCGPRESIRRKLYAMRAGCDSERGMAKEARVWIESGLAQYPRDPELLFRAGAVYRELNDLENSVRSYEILLTAAEKGHIDSLDITMTTYKGHHNLALSYLAFSRYSDAERALRAALAHKDNFVPSWTAMGQLYLKTGQIHLAREVVARLHDLAPEVARQLDIQLAHTVNNAHA